MLGSLTQVRGVRGGATVRFGEVCVANFLAPRILSSISLADNSGCGIVGSRRDAGEMID